MDKNNQAPKDPLGDRMKGYETIEAGRRFMRYLPVAARIDGRSFSAFTRGLGRPYDERLSRLMVETTLALVRESSARVGYTQSDEISLVFFAEGKDAVYFDGRVQKMVSQLAAQATAVFNRLLPEYLPEKVGTLPTFDCRVWAVPNLTEAANLLLWREFDATKNSVSMAARAYYSHKALLGKSSREMQEMLFEKGVNWNDYPAFFKRGTYVQRRKVSRPFTADELTVLPPKHFAHANPNLEVERTDYVRIHMPPLNKVVNRERVLFCGEEPQTAP
jgi:tRNA(His) guanylyltransferase